MFNDLNIDQRLTKGLTDSANLAITENTKCQYQTALNHVNRCHEFTRDDMSFPFDIKKTLTYVGFLMEIRRVSSNTISQNMSALRYIHLVQGQDPSCLRPDIVILILRGREHWEQIEENISKKSVEGRCYSTNDEIHQKINS